MTLDDMMLMSNLSEDALAQAKGVVETHLDATPLVRLPESLAPGIERELWAKLETVQPTGSFKVRGAIAATAAYAAEGVPIVTASAGNHGLGMAHAASTLGVRTTIVVPQTASSSKIDALRAFDTDLRLIGNSYDEAEQAALEMAAQGGRFVSAYNDARVIAGQASLTSELLQQLPETLRDGFVLAVPVGGGGLMSGSLLAARNHPEVRVVGVEAAASTAVSAAAHEGRVVPVSVLPTIADGLAGNIEFDAVAPTLIRASSSHMVAVNEPSIRGAVGDLVTRAGLAVEGSAAVGLAAIQEGLIPGSDPIVLILTGRNIASELLAQLVAEAAAKRVIR